MSQPIPPNAPRITIRKHLVFDPPKVKEDIFSDVFMGGIEEEVKSQEPQHRPQNSLFRYRKDPKLQNIKYKNYLSFPEGTRYSEIRIKGLMNQSIRSKIMKLSSINTSILMSVNGALNMSLPKLLDEFPVHGPDFRLIKYLIMTICPMMLAIVQTMCSLKCQKTGTFPKDFMSVLSQELEFNNFKKEISSFGLLEILNIVTFILENGKFLDGIMFSIFGTQLCALPILLIMRACFCRLFEHYHDTHKVQRLALEFIAILNANKVKVE